MTLKDLQDILHFAEINSMMDWPLIDVVNEYLITKEYGEDYERACSYDSGY